MGIDRATIEAAYAKLRRVSENGDAKGFVDLFAENCTFINPMLDEPVRGRQALRSLTAAWPEFVTHHEWVAIDGNRLVAGWNERQGDQRADSPAYRGISTWVYDDDGLVASYEGFFDPAAVAAATAA